MTLPELMIRIAESPVGVAVAESAVLFPLIECIHVVAVTFVAGTIAMVDLRLIGVSARNHAVTRLTDEILPWTWSAFGLALASGALLFSSNAEKYFVNGPFRFKMICMALAAVNMLIFHLVTQRSIEHWDDGVPTPIAAKVAGVLSLVFWALVIGFGRWIGFTLGA